MEVQCPECRTWNIAIDTMPDFVFALWAWENGGADCPSCGYTVLFESECKFREVEDEK